MTDRRYKEIGNALLAVKQSANCLFSLAKVRKYFVENVILQQEIQIARIPIGVGFRGIGNVPIVALPLRNCRFSQLVAALSIVQIAIVIAIIVLQDK